MFFLPYCSTLSFLSFSLLPTFIFAVMNVRCHNVNAAEDFGPPPDPLACSLLLSHLPSLPNPSSRQTPIQSAPLPSSLSLPFLPRILLHAPACQMRLDFSCPRGALPYITAPDLTFELYSRMKVAGLEVIRRCTGENRYGGYATGVVEGFKWRVATRQMLPEAEWRSILSVPIRQLQGQDVPSLLKWETTIWEV